MRCVLLPLLFAAVAAIVGGAYAAVASDTKGEAAVKKRVHGNLFVNMTVSSLRFVAFDSMVLRTHTAD